MRNGFLGVIGIFLFSVLVFCEPIEGHALMMRRTVNPNRMSNPFGVRENRFLSNRTYGTSLYALRSYKSLGDTVNSWGRKPQLNVSGNKIPKTSSQAVYSRSHWSSSID